MEKQALQELEKQALTYPEKAKLVIVKDNESLLKANEFLHAIKKMLKMIGDTFQPIIDKAHQAHKEALAQRKKYERPLVVAEQIVKSQIGPYLAEQARIRRKAEEKARREQEKRKRLEEEKFQKALEVENAGKNEEAERIINEEIPEAKPIVPIPQITKPEGTSIRKIPKWRLIDEKKVPREFLIVDSAKITRLVKETKGRVQIPGIEVYFEDSVTVRL